MRTPGAWMAFPYGSMTFLVGVVYGFFVPGRHDKKQLFLRGALFGLILAAILSLIGNFIDISWLGFGSDLLGLLLTFVVLTMLFVVGAWVGDILETQLHKKAPSK